MTPRIFTMIMIAHTLVMALFGSLIINKTTGDLFGCIIIIIMATLASARLWKTKDIPL